MEDLQLVVSATSGRIYARGAGLSADPRPTSVINFAVGEWARPARSSGLDPDAADLAAARRAVLARVFAAPAIFGVLGWLVEALTVSR